MYKIREKEELIKLIQKYLQKIGQTNNVIAPTGVFDEITKSAVMNFQAKHLLESNGIVDKITLKTLYIEYINFLEKETVSHLGIKFPLSLGDFDESILHLNRSLQKLMEFYGEYSKIQINNYFSLETERAVRMLQKIYNLEDTGVVDELLYLRIMRDLSSIRKFSS